MQNNLTSKTTKLTAGTMALTAISLVSISVQAPSVHATAHSSTVVNSSLSADLTAPTAPTGVTGTSPKPGTIVLQWNASSDNVAVTGYNIYKGDERVGKVTAKTLSYTVRQLASGAVSTYTVEAFDAAGNLSAKSTPVQLRNW